MVGCGGTVSDVVDVVDDDDEGKIDVALGSEPRDDEEGIPILDEPNPLSLIASPNISLLDDEEKTVPVVGSIIS